ncbi:MAG: tetratricopeptide repeat protein [Candidatus Kapabacteria bacterium]|nr:tetratricopeptide repeat protein [Candidatus Kapabacteria bacterium]
MSIGVAGCLQNVRKGYVPPRYADQPLPGKKAVTVPKNRERFSDTVVVKMVAKQSPLVQQFNAAQALFDEGKYIDARKLFSEVVENLAQNDSLVFETEFMIAECAISLAEYEPAAETLNTLLRNESLPTTVHERTLLRLAQLNCVQGNVEKATKLFAEFQREYPKSQFTAMANCDTIKAR